MTPAAGAQLPNQIFAAYAFRDWETQQRTDTFLTLTRQFGNYYSGVRDDRAFGAGVCPQRLFTQNDQFFFLNPSQRIPIGSRVAVAAVVRPIVELKECTPQVIPTAKVVNRTQWAKRPGMSTATPDAASAKMGVKVHCQNTSNGEQGTLRVVYTDKTTEIIGITCKN